MFAKFVVNFNGANVYIDINTTKTILSPSIENTDENTFINADMRSVVSLWRGYSAPWGENTKAVVKLLVHAVARLPICVDVTLWRGYKKTCYN